MVWPFKKEEMLGDYVRFSRSTLKENPSMVEDKYQKEIRKAQSRIDNAPFAKRYLTLAALKVEFEVIIRREFSRDVHYLDHHVNRREIKETIPETYCIEEELMKSFIKFAKKELETKAMKLMAELHEELENIKKEYDKYFG